MIKDFEEKADESFTYLRYDEMPAMDFASLGIDSGFALQKQWQKRHTILPITSLLSF